MWLPVERRYLLAIVTREFEQAATVIAERTADLLSAEVSVVDERGVVVASSESDLVGVLFDPTRDSAGAEYLEVPVRLDNQSRRVIIVGQQDGEVISPRLARSLVELVVDQTAVVDRLPNKLELKNTFIHKLLHGATEDEAAILREAQILGMDLAPPRAVIVIDAASWILQTGRQDPQPPSEQLVRQRAQVIIGSVVEFFELPTETICAYLGDGEVVVLKASNKRNLSRWVVRDRQEDSSNPSWANLAALQRAGEALLRQLRARVPVKCRSSISIGIGRHHPGLDGLARSYQDARVALSLGRRLYAPNGVHCLDRLGIAAFVGVSDERTKIDLARYLLSPLDHEPELLATLDAFFANNCCPSATSRQLSIHRNTLSYRLDKIASLAGLDPRCFDEAVQIRLALVLRSIAGDTTETAVTSGGISPAGSISSDHR